jgi:hypothetical protein
MPRLALAAVFALVLAPQSLVYKPTAAEPRPITSTFTYALKFTGADALVAQLQSSNPILSVSELRATRKGKLTIDGEKDSHIQVTFESSHVEGLVAAKPFQLDFAPGAPAPAMQDLSTPQKVAQLVSWGLTMGPRNFTLGPTGDYSLVDTQQDAQGEATGVIVDAPVRLPGHAITAGGEWTSDWIGKRPQKNNGAVFKFHQTAKLLDMSAGPSPRAHISFVTTGTLEVPPAKNPQGEVTSLDAKGTVTLDVASGVVVGIDAAGAITTELKQAGLKIERRLTSKLQVP